MEDTREKPKSPDELLKWILDSYQIYQMTIREIATAIEKSYTYVRDVLRRNKIPLRSYKEAQSLAIKKGKHTNPKFANRKHSAEARKTISDKVSKSWEQNPKRKEEYAQRASQKWAARTQEEKEKILQNAWSAMREAAKEGSKLERFLLGYLGSLYPGSVRSHTPLQELVLGNLDAHQNAHVDVLITGEVANRLGYRGIAIEIDGPSHYMDIWGEDKLAQVKESDSKKNNLLIGAGFFVIRLKHTTKNIYRKALSDLGWRLATLLESQPESNLIYIEAQPGKERA